MPTAGLHIGRNRVTGRPLVIGWDKLLDHALLLGRTRSGKSTLLEYWIRQCIANRFGFVLLDPEGTLYKRVLWFFCRCDVDPERIKLIDLTEQTYCAGLNHFDLADVNYEDQADIVMEAILKLTQDDDAFRPLIEKYGLASLRALAKAGYPLAFLYDFLHNDTVRQTILRRAGDRFSTMEWNSWDEGTLRDQKVEILGILNRASLFESRMQLRARVSTRENAIDWSQAMDDGQFVLANLQHRSKRVRGYVGRLLIDQLTNATLARDEGRPPFFAFVDEFSQFASRDFLDALKRFGKRRVHVVLSTQDLGDFRTTPEDTFLFESAKNNTELQIVFAMRNFEYARQMALQLFPLQITGRSIKYQGTHPVFKPVPRVDDVETITTGVTSPGSVASRSETFREGDDADEIIHNEGLSAAEPTYSQSVTRTTQHWTDYEEMILNDTPVFNTPQEEEIYFAAQLFKQQKGECHVLYDARKPPLPIRTPAPGSPAFIEKEPHPDNLRDFIERIYGAMQVPTYEAALIAVEAEVRQLSALPPPAVPLEIANHAAVVAAESDPLTPEMQAKLEAKRTRPVKTRAARQTSRRRVP